MINRFTIHLSGAADDIKDEDTGGLRFFSGPSPAGLKLPTNASLLLIFDSIFLHRDNEIFPNESVLISPAINR